MNQNPEDQEPVTDFSKMVAYLYGETLGQEDEAWFQGNIVGKTTMQFMQDEYTLYDVTLVLEDNLPALIRIATKNDLYKNFKLANIFAATYGFRRIFMLKLRIINIFTII
jgi:hypothetical protein